MHTKPLITVSVRLNEKQRDLLAEITSEEGLGIGPWLRVVGLREAKRRLRRERAEAAERAA